MARRSLLPEAVDDYVCGLVPESDLFKRLRAETSKLEQAGMQIGPDQAALLPLLVRSVTARRALEIGTFTGMSALAVALALPPDGKLVACDVSDEWTQIARRYWREAGVASRIDLRQDRLDVAGELMDPLPGFTRLRLRLREARYRHTELESTGEAGDRKSVV